LALDMGDAASGYLINYPASEPIAGVPVSTQPI
jgi:hypothetical protein